MLGGSPRCSALGMSGLEILGGPGKVGARGEQIWPICVFYPGPALAATQQTLGRRGRLSIALLPPSLAKKRGLLAKAL